MRKQTTLFVLGLLALLSESLMAHHGFAQYFDRNTQVRIEGTVHAVSMRNPHTHIEIAVANDAGGADIWSCETQAKTILARKGIRENKFVIGEEIVVTGSQARQDPHGCEVGAIYFADGSSITLRTPEGRAVIAVAEAVEQSVQRDSIYGRWVRNNFAGQTQEPGSLDLLNEAGLAASAEYNSYQDDPSLHCQPSTAIRIWIAPGNPSEIRREGDQIVMQHEFMDTTRVIYLNPETAPAEIEPSDTGFAIGRFEGDTLIVETSHFSAGVLISHTGPGREGVVHSDELTLTERYSINERGELEFRWEATDPPYLNGVMRGGVTLSPTELPPGEYNCEVTINEEG